MNEHKTGDRAGAGGDLQARDLNVLANLSRAMRVTSNGIFVKAGAGLQCAATIFAGIGKAFEALPRELDSPELIEATARIARFGDQVGELIAAAGRERQETAKLLDTIGGVGASVGDLDRTVRLVGILALNAHVVAADASFGDGGLTTIADSATRLAEDASRRIELFRSLYRELAEVIGEAARQQATT